jgi:peptidoglycan/LPS O-acetylase OafA/YrhL
MKFIKNISKSSNFSMPFDLTISLRAILALGIIWHELQPPKLIFYFPVNIPGRIYVWLFYVLSGYVISKSFHERKYLLQWSSVRMFYWRRLIRILPVFYCAYFVTWYLFGTSSIWNINTIRDLLFLHYWFNLDLFGHAWFLGPLVQFYILFPLIFFLIEKLKFKSNPLKMFGFVILINIALKYISCLINYGLYGSGSMVFDDRTMLGNLGLFLFGYAILPLERVSFQGFKKSHLMKLGILTIVICSIGRYWPGGKYFFRLPTSVMIGMSGVFLILYCNQITNELQERVNRGLFSKLAKLFFKLGVLSYGIYLWRPIGHILTMRVIPHYQDNYGYFILVFFIVSSITIILSYLGYHVIEKPFAQLRNPGKIFLKKG